jgi:hypothetical protein
MERDPRAYLWDMQQAANAIDFIETSLPDLREAVSALLAELGPPDT